MGFRGGGGDAEAQNHMPLLCLHHFLFYLSERRRGLKKASLFTKESALAVHIKLVAISIGQMLPSPESNLDL